MTLPLPEHPRDVTLPAYLDRLRALAARHEQNEYVHQGKQQLGNDGLTWGQVARLVAVAEGFQRYVTAVQAAVRYGEITIPDASLERVNAELYGASEPLRALAALAAPQTEEPR